ncbi:MAG: hypothetical protein QF662_02640 [Phycisphaerae bacterium]|jgi:hypothetical protein|nr:hypothetical protein [Phycisphaerae bacterium]
MTAALRPWWGNCDGDPQDKEIVAIDAMEDSLEPLDEQAAHIRALIRSLQLCHHKAERHVNLIVEAIGSGSSTKDPRKAGVGCGHPREELWKKSYDILSAWCSGSVGESAHLDVEGTPATELAAYIGEKTPLKVWQVERICDKFRAFMSPTLNYVEMVEHRDYVENEYKGHLQFRDLTVQAIVHDKKDGDDAEISLASAIDHLEPCNWNFLQNLVIVLKAIGGDLSPKTPLAAHGRNIKMNPIRERMRLVSDALRAFCEGNTAAGETDAGIFRALGEKTAAKHWLAASLDKTIRLQFGL